MHFFAEKLASNVLLQYICSVLQQWYTKKQININDNIDNLKTLTIMGTIITAATIMAMYLNSTGNVNSQYYYNADIENGQVKTMYVYDKQGESLSGKLEYRYTYDNQGRVTSKEVVRRDARTGRMTPESLYTYTYTTDGYTMERNLWNASTHAFDRADGRTEYRRETESVMSVTNYEVAEDGTVTAITDNMLVMLPANEGLMAEF